MVTSPVLVFNIDYSYLTHCALMLLNDLRSRGMMKQGLRGVTLLNSFNTWAGFN